MQMFVTVRNENGRYVARLQNDDRYKAEGTTANEAVEKINREVERLVSRGEIRFVDIPVPQTVPASLGGTFRDDPTLREIVADAYRYRDELKTAEFPE